MKRILSLALSACLVMSFLAGCTPSGSGGGSGNSGKPSAETPMGRYIEEQGEVLENLMQIYQFRATSDGGATFFGRVILDETTGSSDYSRYTIPTAGGPVAVESVSGLNEFAPFGVRDMAEGPDGTLYILYSPDDGYKLQVAKRVAGGAFERVAVADLGEPGGENSVSMDGIGGSVSIGGDADTDSSADADSGSISIGGSVSIVPESAAEPAAGDTATFNAVESVDGSKSGAISFGGEDAFPSKFASGIRATSDGFLVLYGDKGASRYTADGALVSEFSGTAYASNTVVHGDTLLMANADLSALQSYDIAQAKQNGTYTPDSMGYGLTVALDDENVYVADASGIYSQAKGSTLWEKLVDGDLTSLVMPTLSLSGLAPDGKGGFHAVLADEEGAQIMRYTYSPDTPTNPDTELSIFSLNDNNTIRQAIGEFQRRNPNVRVNFRVGLDGESAATTEDVIRALNTELLAGKGPDLIVLDGLNADSYIEKGVLADMSGILAKMDGLLPNLMKAYEQDGKIYGVPSRFTFPVMMGAAADVDGMNSLQTLVERVKADQGGEIPFLRPSNDLWSEGKTGMMMDYYESIAPAFMKEDGTIDQSALTDYLTAMTELDGTVKEHAPQLGGTTAMVTMAVSSIGAGGFEAVNMGPMDLKNGLARFHIQEMAGVFGLEFVSQNLGSMEGQKMASLFGGNAYTPKGAVGVNAAGKQQELAASFVELLLSATVQDSYLYDGYSVNESSLNKLVSDTLGDDSNGDMGFLDICKALNTPLLTDRVIRDAVEAQVKSLMDGSATPDQAAATIVEKTKLYLAE